MVNRQSFTYIVLSRTFTLLYAFYINHTHPFSHSFTSHVCKVSKQPMGWAIITHLQEKKTQNNSSRCYLLELPRTFFTSASRRPPFISAPSNLRHGIAGGPTLPCPQARARACGRPSLDRWQREARRWT